jgi:hypothetical protein
MELCRNNTPGLSKTSARVMNGEHRRLPVSQKRATLTSRVRRIDCVLADIQAEIEQLRRERTHLRLVRGELAGMEAKRRESSPCSTSSG